MNTKQIDFSNYALSYPYPIASSCRRFIDNPPHDVWQEWEKYSRDILQPVLQYLSHILLSDLVALDQKPAHLYHRIQAILSRPMIGHYAGFLRETARYYKEKELQSSIPELIDFLYDSEIEQKFTPKKEQLIGTLVNYRNLFSHGKIEDRKVVEEITNEVRELTHIFLEKISFLTDYPLVFEDGTKAMGGELNTIKEQPVFIKLKGTNELKLRPLLLKLKKNDLLLLEDHDLKKFRLVFKGSNNFRQYKRKDLKKGRGKDLLDELIELLKRVRSDAAVLDHVDWHSFRERTSIITEKTLSLYEDMHKYVPKLYVPRPEWEGKESLFEKFLSSDQTLLALNGEQGTGKSALVSHLAANYREEGHAVLLINAQRFTFADVKWSGNPYPEYFANELHYSRPFNKKVFKSLLKSAPDDKKVILFIDAINEVDGIENKWNRFRAMDLMLEWISEIAQPNLKIVLSFRVQVYEDFNYLIDKELPDNLKQITYPGNNPNKDWVVDLMPFNIEQAEKLYFELQEYPALGMAPQMNWAELKTKLGDNLTEFTFNPLIFTILLKSHHKQKRINISTKEDLFLLYGERLIDSSKHKTWAWWRKVLGFLKDGNITHKEQFLADMIVKTAEQGGGSFMLEDLNPGSKRDKRILKLIDDPNDSSISDLKNGGLIVEENIEFKKNEEEINKHRITFVSEMLEVSMEKIDYKIGNKKSFRERIMIFMILIVSVYLSSFLFKFLYISMVVDKMDFFLNSFPALYSINFINQFQRLFNLRIDYFQSSQLYMILSLILISMLQRLFMKSEYNTINSKYLLENSIIRSVFGSQVKMIYKFILYFVCILFFIIIVLIQIDMYEILDQISLIIIFVLIISLINLMIPNNIYKYTDLNINPKLLMHSLNNALIHRERSKYMKYKLRILCIQFVILIFFSYFILNIGVPLFPEFKVVSLSEVTPQIFLQAGNMMLELIPKVRIILIISGFLFLLGDAFFITLNNYISEKIIKSWLFYFRHHHILNTKKRSIVFYVIYSILIMFLISFVFLFSKSYITDQRIDKYPNFLYDKNITFKTYRNKIVEIDLSNYLVSQKEIDKIKKYPTLKKLKLSKEADIILDLTWFSSLTDLSIPAECLRNLHKNSKLSITLLDPKGFILDKGYYIRKLIIDGLIEDFSFLSYIYGGCEIEMNDLPKNTKCVLPYDVKIKYLSVKSDKAPFLSWLGENICEHQLRLEYPIGKETQNINKITRLQMPVDSLTPNLLKKADNLRWLDLRISENQNSQFYQDLFETVKNHLPMIENINFRYSSRTGLFKDYNRFEALDSIAVWINNPK